MTMNRGGMQKRLARLELRQRLEAFAGLASVLDDYEALSPERSTQVLQELVCLFEKEHDAGVPVEKSLDKLPPRFKTEVYKILWGGPPQEAKPVVR